MNLLRPVLINLLGLLLLVPALALADTASEARDIINKAIMNAGGTAWGGITTMLVHESQTRNTDSGILAMEIVHTLDTRARGYRMEISSTQGKQIYGWDGRQFWAELDGKVGEEAQIKEARRLISDAYYRFSLPFVLDDSEAQMEYVGKDNVNGVETDLVKITYKGGPVDNYWKAGDDQHQDHQQHSAEKPEPSAEEHAGHGGESGGHHSANQVYFYHFDKDFRIVKVYFSHHGDDSYETFLFEDFVTVDGVTREQQRKLIRADGNTLYDTKFTRIEFSDDVDENQYQSPHH